MAASDLTTLAAVRDWCGVPSSTTTADTLMSRLISSASSMVLAYLGRGPLYSQAITERYDGTGATRMLLKRFPVTAVSSVSVDNVLIPAATLPGPGQPPLVGWLLEPWDGTPPGKQQMLDLFGDNVFFGGLSNYSQGKQNVVVSYTAGYLVANEQQAVPANGGAVQVTAPYGPWSVDGGVTMNGVAMTLVSSTPVSGQYSLSSDVPGQYTFAAADAGNTILISYSFIPADLFDVTTQIVGERYRYKGRIGEVSKGAAGETTSFSQLDLPATAKLLLQPYRRVTIF